MMIVFEVDGKPVGQAVRVTRAGKMYKPEHVNEWRKKVADAARRVRPPALIEGPIFMDLVVRVPVPKSWPKHKREDALAGKIYPTSKPDLKNYLAAVEDALTGVLYKDDSQIVGEELEKHYSDAPGIRVVLEAL